MSRLACIARTECVDLSVDNEHWKNVDFVFEYVRCFFPTFRRRFFRFFQILKEFHLKTDRWSNIQPLYRDLYHVVYEDINPETGVLSNGPMETQPCVSKMSDEIVKTADKELTKLLDKNAKEALRLKKKQCEIIAYLSKSVRKSR